MIDKELLRYRMRAAGKSYKDIAADLGVSVRTIASKFNGKSDWTLTELKAVAVSCEIPAEDFQRIFFNERVE